MIKDFETNARHEEHLKKIRKKKAAEMKKYEETIQHMKELREETYQRKNNELKKKLKKKEQLLITSLENKQKDKMKERERAIAEMIEKENQAKKNVEKFQEEQEKLRLKFEREIHDKSKWRYKIISFIIIIVENFKNHNEKLKEETRKKYAKKNIEAEKRHENNLKKLNIENERLAKETEEKEFKKYIGFYWLRKAQERALRQKTKEKNNRLKEKAERIEELQKENIKKGKEIIAKIRKREVIKEKFEKEKNDRLRLEIIAREEKMRRCNTQKKELAKEQNEKILDILDYQYELLIKGKKKDKINEMKRINAGEQTVINQMVLEKNLSDFYKRMNRLKDQSVYKKTPEQRYKIYRDLKRAEAERRKKELEEKLDKLLSKQ